MQIKKGLTSEGSVVYTTKDVQETLKCSKSQAYKLMNNRMFPSFKIGKRIYVTAEDFKRFLAQNKRKKIIL